MKILALETSSRHASVAILEGSQVVSQTLLPAEQRTAQAITPAMANLLNTAGWRPADVQLVTTTVGPGSFTGLRIGITAAKTFAYAVGCEVLGIDTLAVIAAQASSVGEVWVAQEAERGQLVIVPASFDPDGWPVLGASQIQDAIPWLSQLPAGTAITGPGLTRVRDRIPAGIQLVDPALWTPQAATVGRIAERDFSAGRRGDLWTLSAVYYRPSGAEEKGAVVSG